jgi:hypothetical protein
MFAGNSVLLLCQHTFYQEAVISVAFCTFNLVSDWCGNKAVEL